MLEDYALCLINNMLNMKLKHVAKEALLTVQGKQISDDSVLQTEVHDAIKATGSNHSNTEDTVQNITNDVSGDFVAGSAHIDEFVEAVTGDVMSGGTRDIDTAETEVCHDLVNQAVEAVADDVMSGALNLQDLKMTDQIAGLENARPGK